MKQFGKSSGEWTWEPFCENAAVVFGSGAATSTQQSTYADERDDRSDTDRPDEGSRCIA